MKKKILVLISSIIVIGILMPRNVFMEMSVFRGDRWDEATLTANFDVPLLKSDKQREEDLKLVESSFEPIYTLDTDDIASISEPAVATIYRTGIISDAEVERTKCGIIRIAKGNTLKHVPAVSVPTISQVKEMLGDSLSTLTRIPASVVYNEQLSKEDYASLMKKVSETSGIIHEGEVIVSEGQFIDENTQLRIDSYIHEYQSRMGNDIWWLLVVTGRFIIIAIVMCMNLLFFNKYLVKNIDGNFKSFSFMIGSYVTIILLFALVKYFSVGGEITLYTIPVTIIPVLFLVLFNTRTAIIGNITISLVTAMFTQVPFEFFTVNALAGMTAILVLQNFCRRSELFKAILYILGTEILTVSAFILIEGYSLFSMDNLKMILVMIVNNVLLLGFYQSIYLIEKSFGFVTNITLQENSDTNQPLLLELSHKAPGTFQHSVQVANIAEAAAKLIGANHLMVRCGALYHDIGKMKHPEYFIENSGGGYNPHNDLTPQESAKIIKGHVSDGLEIAQQNKLPECITRFIGTHHGNSLIAYFYKKALESNPEVDTVDFRYPGQNPKSKEECICMMCDTIEAASRSLPSYDKQSINELVENLVENQIKNGHFTESELTFNEVAKIKELLKQQLHNIYHVRIAYPK